MKAIKSDETKYKTDLCKNWMEKGKCNYGNRCRFAHGKDELNFATPKTNNYKTKECKQFHDLLVCNYGPKCHFIHEHQNA